LDTAQAKLFANSLTSQVVGGWNLQSVLGFGKSAVVFEGVSGELRAAVKIFHPELVEKYGRALQLTRIERECGLIGVAHPNVIKIIGGGECGVTGCLFVAMELLHQPTLEAKLADFPREKIRAVISQLASAAKFLLDEHRIAHRDIKPSNVVISEDYGSATLLDLGVIKPIGIDNLTDQSGTPFVGTLQYSSPEFLRRQEVDSPEGWKALALYQLGGVLHDLIMRRALFSDRVEPFSELVVAVLDEQPHVWANDVDPELITLCRHCLTKDPTLRLKLVDWSHFEIPSGDPVSLAEKIAKVKRMQDFHRGAGSVTNSENDAEAKQARLDSAVDELIAAIDRSIGQIGDLPPRRITALYCDGGESASCRLVFQRGKGIPYRLCVEFVVRLISEKEFVYELSSAVGISDEAPTHEWTQLTHTVRVTGFIDEIVAVDDVKNLLVELIQSSFDFFGRHGSSCTQFMAVG
jgi:serine/threonine protein kinase